MPHKSGFVNIIGNPNVGKSTIMNVLVGEKLSIITSKAQTTRHRIMGIVNGEDFQIVYSDTPGILKPNYKLQESMMKFVSSALVDADIILYITDVIETFNKNEDFLKKLKKIPGPIFLLINKIDLTNQKELDQMVDQWRKLLPSAKIFPVSALEKFNLDAVFDAILEALPEGPPYFPKDTLTDKTERFFVAEIIREKIIVNYRKEIPYAVEVEVESFKESKEIIKIRALIYVERETQKGIIIGHKGQALKKIGIGARKDIELFLNKKIYLELFVKVDKGWRKKDSELKKFGYNL